MWSDNETTKDFLNYSSVATTVAKIIEGASGQPISIGVSGSWGEGKSSLIKLIRLELEAQEEGGEPKRYLFVEFNAWLYQGYDDAKASLMDVIAQAIMENAEKSGTALDKTKDLLARVNWLRAAKLSAGSVAAMAAGLPPVGVLGELLTAGRSLTDGDITGADIDSADQTASKAANTSKSLLRPQEISSPPKEIEAIRSGFEDALSEMNLTLIVLIDDLDRCLPETAISTLEAVRLFLFLENTAFVIAADTKMIRHAVSKHFDGLDDKLITNYFDKLIQIPIAMPKLGTQDIRAYLSMLYIEASSLNADQKEKLRVGICRQLGQTWAGERVDRTYVRELEQKLEISVPPELAVQLDMVDRMAPLMASETAIEANPRLIKRLMNAISIRKAFGAAQGMTLDESVLTKMLILERCGSPEAFDLIAQSSAGNDFGFPEILGDIEKSLRAGENPELNEVFSTEFFKQWVVSDPALAEIDLRPTLFVSQEHAPLLLSGEKLTTAGAELLEALLAEPDMASDLQAQLVKLSEEDLDLIMNKVIEVSKTEQVWGIPSILSACMQLAKINDTLASRFANFLSALPAQNIEPSIVERIKDEPWSDIPFSAWKVSSVSQPVIKAIQVAET